jgi:menaquinone-9 beta-reductase
MASLKPITILGGGLAGLTLGIALRQRELPVTVFESGSYPRHRVCGEFICGGGVEVLRNLGLHGKFVTAGAIEARTAAFYLGNRAVRPKILPYPALCLSRFAMDELLAAEFRCLGGQLHEQTRITSSVHGHGYVRATGRRLEHARGRVKWIGLKAHARRVALETDLEMHVRPDGYVGLCRLAGDLVNVCGLFAVSGPLRLAEGWPEFMRGGEGAVLFERLRQAEFVKESFCAVSGFNLRPRLAAGSPECCLGDALSMIPPVTGNGMSMAFESALWAADHIEAYSRGSIDWREAQSAVAKTCDAGFARRLRWAQGLQWIIEHGSACKVAVALADQFDLFWELLFKKTR